MKKENKNRVCPVERAGALDTRFRRWIQSPKRILKPYVKEGMHVLDLGCGPGVYTLEMAEMVGENGMVVAADIQEGMLQMVQKKIQGTPLDKIIELHKTSQNSLDLSLKADFTLAFYVLHEIPGKENLYRELHSLLKPGGKLLVIEPKGHVSKKEFKTMILQFTSLGFHTVSCAKVFFSRTVLLQKAE
jgi:ubiquinone/menaquinone biosynthesis C-methylase UbiE